MKVFVEDPKAVLSCRINKFLVMGVHYRSLRSPAIAAVLFPLIWDEEQLKVKLKTEGIYCHCGPTKRQDL